MTTNHEYAAQIVDKKIQHSDGSMIYDKISFFKQMANIAFKTSI